MKTKISMSIAILLLILIAIGVLSTNITSETYVSAMDKKVSIRIKSLDPLDIYCSIIRDNQSLFMYSINENEYKKIDFNHKILKVYSGLTKADIVDAEKKFDAMYNVESKE